MLGRAVNYWKNKAQAYVNDYLRPLPVLYEFSNTCTSCTSLTVINGLILIHLCGIKFIWTSISHQIIWKHTCLI